MYTYKSTSFTIFLTKIFFFLVQHVFYLNISRWKLLLLLLRSNLKRCLISDLTYCNEFLKTFEDLLFYEWTNIFVQKLLSYRKKIQPKPQPFVTGKRNHCNSNKCRNFWDTIKPGTPEYGTTEHGTPEEYRSTGGIQEYWRNNWNTTE